jgi:glycosyltransferase involved in cell wall biosynthesis
LVDGDAADLQRLDITYHAIGPKVRRGGTGDFELISKIKVLIHELSPTICHFVSLRAVTYGLIAARNMRTTRCVSSITGLGFLFIEKSVATIIQRHVMGNVIRWASKNRNSTFIFQNAEDKAIFETAGWTADGDIDIVAGSGVDTSRFVYSDANLSEISVLFPARYLVHKGIIEFVDAARIVKRRFRDVRFLLVGSVDPNNPATVSQELIDRWVEDGVVEDLGYQNDMPAVMRDSTIVCLPSYREGLPKVLLEAAASGRALVATDVVGCRDVVRHGWNGFIADPRSSESLAMAIEKLVESPAQIRIMGRNSRDMVASEYDSDTISQKFEKVYRRMVADQK